jgi:hypothetical protein
VTRDRLLAVLAEYDDDEPFTMRAGKLRAALEESASDDFIPLAAAATIMDVPPRTLRGRAARWHAMQREGQRPQVRVARMGAHWRLSEADCWQYRRRSGGPRVVTEEKPALDDRQEMIDRYVSMV